MEAISVRQLRALNHSMRIKILTSLKESIRLLRKDDTSYCLEKNRIKKVCKAINNAMNPFDENIDKNVLLNISTGRAASQHVTNFLLNKIPEVNKAHM